MNLTADIGNSRMKVVVFEGHDPVESFVSAGNEEGLLERVLCRFPQLRAAISVSCRAAQTSFEEQLSQKFAHYVRLDHKTSLPISNLYSTPETLGYDRIAAAVGASVLLPSENVLIVDYGTAITFDMLTARGEFLGGNISPGLRIRQRALSEFTGKLPLVPVSDQLNIVSNLTSDAVANGISLGIVLETEGYIERLAEIYPSLKVIFTGGDAPYFAKQSKKPIFADYDLVARGLNRILEYNAK